MYLLWLHLGPPFICFGCTPWSDFNLCNHPLVIHWGRHFTSFGTTFWSDFSLLHNYINVLTALLVNLALYCHVFYPKYTISLLVDSVKMSFWPWCFPFFTHLFLMEMTVGWQPFDPVSYIVHVLVHYEMSKSLPCER